MNSKSPSPSRRRALAFVLGLARAAPFVPSPALAHAVLVESDPRAGAALAPGPHPFMLRYNSRIDPARSALTLLGPDHLRARLAVHPGAGPDTLRADADLARAGHYDLRWQVLAVDGHITRGDIAFTVSGGDPDADAAKAP